MRNTGISIIFVILIGLSSNLAAKDQETALTPLDEYLSNGLTVAETLAAWDQSAVRYYSEPPEPKVKQTSKKIEAPKQQKTND